VLTTDAIALHLLPKRLPADAPAGCRFAYGAIALLDAGHQIRVFGSIHWSLREVAMMDSALRELACRPANSESILPLSQRRNVDRDDINAVVEILREVAGMHHCDCSSPCPGR